MKRTRTCLLWVEHVPSSAKFKLCHWICSSLMLHTLGYLMNHFVCCLLNGAYSSSPLQILDENFILALWLCLSFSWSWGSSGGGRGGGRGVGGWGRGRLVHFKISVSITFPGLPIDFINDCDMPNCPAMMSWRRDSAANKSNSTSAADLQALTDRFHMAAHRTSQDWDALVKIMNMDCQAHQPSLQDWGLWCVKCRVGHPALVSLLQVLMDPTSLVLKRRLFLHFSNLQTANIRYMLPLHVVPNGVGSTLKPLWTQNSKTFFWWCPESSTLTVSPSNFLLTLTTV